MATISLQVKDFLPHGGFEQENPEAVVIAIWHDENGVFHESAIYKWETAADNTEVYLYLSGERQTSPLAAQLARKGKLE